MTTDLLDHLRTPVVTLDRAGRISSANRAFTDLVGSPSIGDPLGSLFRGVLWEEIVERSASAAYTCTLARAGTLFSTVFSSVPGTARGSAPDSAAATPTSSSDAGLVIAEFVAHGDEHEFPDLTQTRRMISALEHSGEAIVITDRNARIVYVNPEFERVMGYSREEVIGGHNRLWRSGVHDAEFYAEGWERLQRGETWRGELVNKRRDGTLIHEDTTISQVSSRSGEVLGYVEIKRDMTRQRELEQSLAHAQRMESIGTLAGGVAHDYNNVLQTILGHSELILDRFGDQDDLVDLVSVIKRSAEQSASLTRQILAFARREQVWPKPLDTNAEIERTATLMRRLFGPGIELHWRPGSGVWPIRMDPSQLGQIITNICINARDAIEGARGELADEASRQRPGHIEITTDNLAAEAAEGLPLPSQDARQDHVRIRIRDDGRGMEASVRDRIFEPFFTTKPVGAGTGLGLATVYGIAMQNGGRTFVDSEIGRGTTLTILLPRHDGSVEPDTAAPEARRDPAPARTSRVLIVEDEPGILALMTRILEHAGYEVTACGDPEAAIRRAAEIEALELVVADVIMPGMNGRDAARAIRELHPQAQVLFVSGYTAEFLKDLPEDERDAQFLQKPFSRDALIAKVATLIAGD